VSNFPPDFCPYCGSSLETVDEPTVYRCGSCEDYVFHNPTLGCGVVVVDGERVLLVEDFRESGAWKVPEGRPEIPESPREGAARELEEETGLAVAPEDLVYLFEDAKEVVEGMYTMGVYYGVDRSETRGNLEAGDDATNARFWTQDEFAASEHTFREMPREGETRSTNVDLGVLAERTNAALEGGSTHGGLFADVIND